MSYTIKHDIKETINNMRESLIDCGIVTENEIWLAECLNGTSRETMETVLYIFTGYSDFDEYLRYA